MNSTILFDGISWAQGPDLPEPRFSHGLVAYHRTKVLVFAGQGHPDIGFLWTTHEYDFKYPDIGWTRKADFPILCRGTTFAHIK